jgi:hypothetical protein
VDNPLVALINIFFHILGRIRTESVITAAIYWPNASRVVLGSAELVSLTAVTHISFEMPVQLSAHNKKPLNGIFINFGIGIV